MTITYKFLTYPVTSSFGAIDNIHSLPHKGLDLAVPVGTPAQSLTNGIIGKITTNDPILGASVRVDVGNGQEWIYGHLSQVNVQPGQHIAAGDSLGLTGGIPGTWGAGHSTGAHIHLANIQNGLAVDPTQVLNQGGFWDSVKHFFTTPGADLAGLPPMKGPVEYILEWLGHGLHAAIQIMPEVCILFAMGFLLIGMCGSHKAMRMAGTSTLLSFVGVLLNAALN